METPVHEMACQQLNSELIAGRSRQQGWCCRGVNQACSRHDGDIRCNMRTVAMVCVSLPLSFDFLSPRAMFHNLDSLKDLSESLGLSHQILTLSGLNFPQKVLGIHS